MRYGFTTGSCAAAAAKAAAYMLLTGKRKEQITIETPKGIPYHARIEEIEITERAVRCAVRKDGGDDPDVTTGILIAAEVSELQMSCGLSDLPQKLKADVSQRLETDVPQQLNADAPHIEITGGTGVGIVTRPGLDQPVGAAAINHVPREMIVREVAEVCRLADYAGGLLVEIFVPEGKELAEKTFNPRLGIVGGISILGTTGIVEPMSSQALLDTIRVELRQRRAEGAETAVISPGNYGLEFMKRAYGFDLTQSVKCSNFIGQTLDMAAELGYRELLLVGHIGKLVKLAGGIMNTHSKEADCRMELLAAAALKGGVKLQTLQEMLACLTTEEALALIQKEGRLERVMELLMERIMFYLSRRAGEALRVECIVYANEFGELAKSGGALELLEKAKGDW